VIGSWEVQRVRGYRFVPMICPELQSKACIFEAYAGAAEPAEDVGEGDTGGLPSGSSIAVRGGQGCFDFGDVLGG
jgi:hypothetical protein